jgi:hypothetical protein
VISLIGKNLTVLPGDTRVIGYCAVFKVREEAGCVANGNRRVTWTSEAPATRRSLKAQQHAARLAAHEALRLGLPGPVDMSSD